MPLSSQRRSDLISGPYTRLLAQHEECLSNLYKCFAAAIPEAKDFWENMSEEEISHKKLIEGIGEKFHNQTWVFTRPKFTTGNIAGSCDRLVTKCESVAKSGISMRDAMKYALEVERSLLESDFFQIIDCDNSGMMSVLQSLSSYTYAHVRELENESKRLKWKFKGGKKARCGECAVLSRETVKENLKTVQGNMIGHLVALEEAVASLYRTYSARLEEYSSFWSKIAAEEMQHAAMIKKLYSVLENGHVFFNIQRFSGDEILTDIDRVLNQEYAARSEKLSQYKALNKALEIENMLVESKFYKTVKSDAPEFKFVAERMVKESQEHLKRLEDEVGKAIDIGVLAAKPTKPL